MVNFIGFSGVELRLLKYHVLLLEMTNHLGFTYFKVYLTVLIVSVAFYNICGISFLDFRDLVSHVSIMEDWGSSLKACNTHLWGKS